MLNVVEGILETRKYCVSIVRYSTFKKDLYCLKHLNMKNDLDCV